METSKRFFYALIMAGNFNCPPTIWQWLFARAWPITINPADFLLNRFLLLNCQKNDMAVVVYERSLSNECFAG